MKKRITIFSICLYLLLGNLFAQDATLEETMTFIRLKTMDKTLWYTTNEQISYSSHCDEVAQQFRRIKTIELRNKRIYFTNDCNETICTLHLWLINSIDLESNTIKFSSTQQIVDVMTGNNLVTVNRPTIVTIHYGETDAPRLLKAFKHLFKLLEINLLGDKF